MSPDSLAPLFSNIWSIALVILFFGASIFVHELGHFLAARRRGLHVERFSIGFGPKLFGWRRDGVDYRVSLLPIGGYVALPQLADMRGIEGDSPLATRLPPISYASKMIVAVMGAVFNIFFAFLLACIIWVFGYPSTAVQQTTSVGFVTDTLTLADGTEVTSPAARAGLQVGDRILSIDGRSVHDWNSLLQTLVASTGRDQTGQPRTLLEIEREGERLEVELHPIVSGENRVRRIGITAQEPLVVGQLHANSPAARAGLQPGDRLVSLNDRPLHSRFQLQHFLQEAPDQPSVLTVERNGQSLDVTLTPAMVQVSRDGPTVPSLGIDFLFETTLVRIDPFTQLANHLTITWRVLSGLINPSSDLGFQHMSGPPGIARVLYLTSQIDLRLLLWVTILINVNLALLNLLPIPVLDGGHMLFATLSKLFRRPLPQNFIAGTQGAFMVMLLGLMLYVSFNDITRWVGDSRAEREFRENQVRPQFEQPVEQPAE
ncbi:MAG: PDZ domain-containing protein [Puniceicoccaceae bacterium]|nr:MAG: PDZ domain-containing protein [Puniceicoccaceae bacterium]